MHTYSDDSTIAAILAVPHWTETRIVFGDISAGDDLDSRAYGEDYIVSCHTEGSLFATSNPSIGNAVAETLTCQIMSGIAGPHGGTPNDAPHQGSFAWPMWRLHADDGSLVTSWHAGKPYDVNKISDNSYLYDCVTVTATDAMARADQAYKRMPSRAYWTSSSSTTPTLPQLVSDIATLMGLDGVETATMTTLNNAANATHITEPDEFTTMRELLCYAAAACGGNFIIAPSNWTAGVLRLQPFADALHSGYIANVREWCSDFRILSMTDGSTRWDVLLTGAADRDHRYGPSDPSFRLEAVCPWADDVVAHDVHALITNCVSSQGGMWCYVGWEARQALADPRLELGDYLGGNFVSGQVMIGRMRRTWDHSFVAELSAPEPARYEADVWDYTANRNATRGGGALRANAQGTVWRGLSLNRNALRVRRVASTPTPTPTATKPRHVQFAHTYTLYDNISIGKQEQPEGYCVAYTTYANLASRLASASGGSVSASDLVPVGAYVGPRLSELAPGVPDAGPYWSIMYENQRWEPRATQVVMEWVPWCRVAGRETSRIYYVDMLYVGTDATVLSYLDNAGAGGAVVSTSSTGTSYNDDIFCHY